MIIRSLRVEDQPKLDELHDKYFSEFEKTDFTKNFLGAFVCCDDKDRIVMGGGIRPVAETIIVTDKSANPHLLGDALLETLRFSKFTAKHFNIAVLYAFVNDPKYAKHLVKHGFNPVDAEALYLSV